MPIGIFSFGHYGRQIPREISLSCSIYLSEASVPYKGKTSFSSVYSSDTNSHVMEYKETFPSALMSVYHSTQCLIDYIRNIQNNLQAGQEDHVQGCLPRRLQQCVERSDDYSRGLQHSHNHILPYLTFSQGTPDQTLHDGAHGVRLLRDLEEGGPADHGPQRPHAQHVRKEAG